MKIGLIIPARKGSKTIKNKNLKLLNNVPLAEHTFKSVKSLNYPKFILSNDKKINKIANKYGIISDYKRPKKVSEDKSSLIETLENFVLWLKNSKYEIDVFVILQVTSPLRRKLDIVNAINFYKKNKFKSLFSVSESQEHPFETINLFKKTKWKYNIPLKKIFTEDKTII